jgi:hypothetical protein
MSTSLKNLTCVLWGEEKTWKSSFAQSFPKPLFHMELDIGGFDRAAWRLPASTRILRLGVTDDLTDVTWSQWDIVTKPYPIPVQLEKLMGAQKIGATVRFPRSVTGYKEVWQSFVVDYVTACQSGCASILFDSATQLWVVCHTSLLQEKQEIQLANGVKPENKDFREKLLPVEYPNDRMRSIVYTAQSYHKNLILTHYPKDVYGERFDAEGRKQEYRTGEVVPDGFKDTQKLADIVIKLSAVAGRNPITGAVSQSIEAKITRCGLPGLGTAATGAVIAPNYDGIVELVERYRADAISGQS